MRAFDHLDVSIDDGVAVVRFTPVPEGDVGRSVFTDLADVFPLAGLERDVRAVVLAGGEDVFFPGAGAGRTKRLFAAGFDALATQFEAQQRMIAQLVALRKPTVAAVPGPARNVGAVIALLCDAAVGSPATTFADTHVRGGVAAGDGGTMAWPLLVGVARARDVLLRGIAIGAEEAKQLRLLSEIVAPEEVLPAARALALELAELAPMAFAGTKGALANYWRLSSSLAWDRALAYEAAGLLDPAHGERPGAYAHAPRPEDAST